MRAEVVDPLAFGARSISELVNYNITTFIKLVLRNS